MAGTQEPVAKRKKPLPSPSTGPPSSTGPDHQDARHDAIDDSSSISVYRSLSTLLLSEKFSDMTIRCGGRDFKAHRAIVCTQSPFFDRAFSRDFKEATSRVIDLPDDDPVILDRFLEFLYTGNYSHGIGYGYPHSKPSYIATMGSEAIQKSLARPSGVICQDAESETASGDEDPGFQEGTEHLEDLEYLSPNGDVMEPDEEYNDFDEEDDSIEESDINKCQVQTGQFEFNDCSRSLVKPTTEEIIGEQQRELQKVVEERNDLFLPLRIYIMADKYDVPALRLLARDRFYRAAELRWEEAECFPDVVDELYRRTLETDTAMREIVCRLVGSRIHQDHIRDKMRALMREHGDFAVGVMEYMIHFGKEW